MIHFKIQISCDGSSEVPLFLLILSYFPLRTFPTVRMYGHTSSRTTIQVPLNPISLNTCFRLINHHSLFVSSNILLPEINYNTREIDLRVAPSK
jgi:hypothetical protein